MHCYYVNFFDFRKIKEIENTFMAIFHKGQGNTSLVPPEKVPAEGTSEMTILVLSGSEHKNV